MLGGLLFWLGLLPLGALAVLDTNLGNQTIERVSCFSVFSRCKRMLGSWTREEDEDVWVCGVCRERAGMPRGREPGSYTCVMQTGDSCADGRVL